MSSEITAAMVRELRDTTSAGMMDCKKALVEVGGDMQKAIDYLREKGLAKASKKADRLASEGIVNVLVNGNLASIIEVNSETDFVAKNDKFLDLVNKTLTHIQKDNISSLDELKDSKIDGVNFDEYLKNQIAIIGENLVVRRFETIKEEAVNGYIHSNKRVAVIIGANCPDESKKEKLDELLKNICMHAAAMKPTVISYKDFDSEFVEKEFVALKAEIEKENEELKRLGKHLKAVPEFGSMAQLSDEVLKKAEEQIKEELKKEGKPEKIWDRILPGKMERFFADNTPLDQRYTLLGQYFVMDDKKTIAQILEEKSKEFGFEIKITKYIRYEVGEGLEKKVDDFAAEVAAQIG